ncbi:ammonium transporter [Acidocella sp. KAb 2-4]|uniref:ammonium transporter n=1 Tax=Acidocella sp. KAb 2-4 TaxID=2885158 RepID=UPI001D06DF79|nr:ammonium transporter [Acidocella sp. KAb 2-4]MCB5943280.1 ammonium transporter [Acidocella sp. KAb 2-4]
MQHVDPGDTAWVLMCTVLVLLMTVPGLALFYAGMVRKKNILATMMQSFMLCALVTVLWVVAGYSLAFTPGDALLGGTSRLLLNGIWTGWNQAFTIAAGTPFAQPTTVPETVFLMFQMSFAIITPAVVTGACADRMKFSAMLLFFTLWSVFVYAPLAHWVWEPTGWLAQMGIADFAGGTVVEINCGITGLVCALMLGRRLGYGTENMAPWNLSYAVIGASLLWIGWMGFNSGGAMGANGRAGMAVLVTQIAAAGATLSWTAVEWYMHGKPSVLGAISGAVAGLVGITPAAGYVLPGPALLIGLAVGFVCYFTATSLKRKLRYDDSLDAFGVHGIAGIIGTLATGWFAFGPLSGGVAQGGWHLLGVQAVGVGATIVYCAVVSWALLKFTDAVIGLRVSRDQEREGLDISLHGEQVF